MRQLENELRRALVLGGDVLREEPFRFAQPKDTAGKANDLNLRGRELDKGNQTRAAELLSVSRSGRQQMLKRLELSFERRIA